GGPTNGIDALKTAIAKAARESPSELKALELPLPPILETHIDRLKKILAEENLSTPDQAFFDAHLMLSGDDDAHSPDAAALFDTRRTHPRVKEEIHSALIDCANNDIDPINAEVETHYAFISTVIADCLREDTAGRGPGKLTRTDKLDRILTHKIGGMAIFIGLMALMFWTIFFFAAPIMDF